MRLVQNILGNLSNIHDSTNNPANYFLYRGQSDIAYNVKPGLFRQYSLQQIYNIETDFIDKSNNFPESNMHRLARLQHNGEPTRLLDWTLNPLVAIFFACIDSPDKDGVIYLLPFGGNRHPLIIYLANLICDIVLYNPYESSYHNDYAGQFVKDIKFKDFADKELIKIDVISSIIAVRFVELATRRLYVNLPYEPKSEYYNKQFLQLIENKIKSMLGEVLFNTVNIHLKNFLCVLNSPFICFKSPMVTNSSIAQSSMFQIFNGIHIPDINGNYQELIAQSGMIKFNNLSINIPLINKKSILKELDQVFNINSKTLYVPSSINF